MKFTVIFMGEGMEMPYSLYCEPTAGNTLEEALKSAGVKEDDIQFIFEGWPRRFSLDEANQMKED